MARPSKLDINSGNQGWDGKIDTNFDVLFEAPIPLPEHSGDESDLESTFAAAAYDRCAIWVDHTVLGWHLFVSDGTEWHEIQAKQHNDYLSLTATTTQLESHEFIHFEGTGSMDYDFLPAASWTGHWVTVRNDGSLAINLDPDSSEDINGSSSSISLAVGSTARIFSNGTELFCDVSL